MTSYFKHNGIVISAQNDTILKKLSIYCHQNLQKRYYFSKSHLDPEACSYCFMGTGMHSLQQLKYLLLEILHIFRLQKNLFDPIRMLATVKNFVVNTVFSIWSIAELPNFCFLNTEWNTETEKQIVKSKSGKNKKVRKVRKTNIKTVVLNENKKKKTLKQTRCVLRDL